MNINSNPMTLDELTAKLRERLGDCAFMQEENFQDGSSRAVIFVHGQLRATFRSRLITPPPADGVTPRGPSEYYDLKFYP